MVRNLEGRLQRLERQTGLGPETEEQRQFRERLDGMRRRDAEYRLREGLPQREDEPVEDLTGLTIAEVLQRGRSKAFLRNRTLGREEPA